MATSYGSTTLHDALYRRGLASRKNEEGTGRILTQKGRDVGVMTPSVGWCLIRLIDEAPLDDCQRGELREARQLFAGLDR